MKTRDKVPSILLSVMLASLIVLVVLIVSACSPEAQRYNQKGNEHFKEGAFEEAVAEYDRAQVDEPDAAQPYYNEANVYNLMRQPEEVLSQTEQAIKTAEPDLASNAWYNLGNVYFDVEQWPQSVEAYQDALRLNPNDSDAKHNLELALQKLQDTEQQQQEEQSSKSQQEQEQQEGESEQGEQEDQSQESQSESSTSEDEDQEQESASAQQSEQTEGMTEEQAMQLLQALLDESQTLQEALQEVHPSQGSPSEQDW